MADYTMTRGDTLRLVSTARNANGSALNLTGYKVWFTVKKNYADPDNIAVHQASSTDGSADVAIADPPSGVIDLRMPALKTYGFPDVAVKLLYDVQIKDALGNVQTAEKGTITVEPDVTITST